MKKIFILVMTLLFTTMLFSIAIDQTKIIENEKGDQDGTFVAFTLPETMSTAEFSSVNDVIVENNDNNATVKTSRYNASFVLQVKRTRGTYEMKKRGSVMKILNFSSANLSTDSEIGISLSAGALKIPTFNINYIKKDITGNEKSDNYQVELFL